MLSLQPIPPRSHQQDFIQASLVNGQVQCPALSRPQSPFHKSAAGIGVQVHHIVEPHFLQFRFDLCGCFLNVPNAMDAGEPSDRLRKWRLGQVMNLYFTFEHGMQSPHHRSGQDDISHAGKPDDEYARHVVVKNLSIQKAEGNPVNAGSRPLSGAASASSDLVKRFPLVRNHSDTRSFLTTT